MLSSMIELCSWCLFLYSPRTSVLATFICFSLSARLRRSATSTYREKWRSWDGRLRRRTRGSIFLCSAADSNNLWWSYMESAIPSSLIFWNSSPSTSWRGDRTKRQSRPICFPWAIWFSVAETTSRSWNYQTATSTSGSVCVVAWGTVRLCSNSERPSTFWRWITMGRGWSMQFCCWKLANWCWISIKMERPTITLSKLWRFIRIHRSWIRIGSTWLIFWRCWVDAIFGPQLSGRFHLSI